MDGGAGQSRLGSFLLGGLLGGLAGVAASRLGRRAPRRPATEQPGLRAFEAAPCFREHLEREREASERSPAQMGDR